MTTINAKKNCVILYSRRHFDPNNTTVLSGSSAGRIAATIYEAAKNTSDHNVYYFDSYNIDEWHPVNADVLVTLIDNLPTAQFFFKPQYTVVIAVNQHPLERLKIGISGLALGLPRNALTPSDGIYQPFLSLSKANSILCVGNKRTICTFKKYLPHTDIHQVNYDSNFFSSTKRHKITKIRNILVLMSSIGYRKGFDRFVHEIENSECLDEYTFHIVGHPEGPYWQLEIERLLLKHSNVKFHGWMLNKAKEFSDLLQTMDVALFPTREEGLVGSLLECIDLGIISLHTSNSGLDHAIDELALSDTGSLNLQERLQALSRKTPVELGELNRLQEESMKRQFSKTPNIGMELKRLLKEGFPPPATSNRMKEILEVILMARKPRNIKLFAMRLKLIQLRHFRNRIALKNPSLFKILKRLRNLFRA